MHCAMRSVLMGRDTQFAQAAALQLLLLLRVMSLTVDVRCPRMDIAYQLPSNLSLVVF